MNSRICKVSWKSYIIKKNTWYKCTIHNSHLAWSQDPNCLVAAPGLLYITTSCRTFMNWNLRHTLHTAGSGDWIPAGTCTYKQWSHTSRIFMEKSLPKYLIFPLILSWKYLYTLGKFYITGTIKCMSWECDHIFTEYYIRLPPSAKTNLISGN